MTLVIVYELETREHLKKCLKLMSLLLAGFCVYLLFDLSLLKWEKFQLRVVVYEEPEVSQVNLAMLFVSTDSLLSLC